MTSPASTFQKLAVFAVIFLLTITASAKKFVPVTVTVKASPDAVRTAAVSQAVAEGYAIEQEGQYQITFQKNMGGVGGFFASALLSPPACQEIHPRWLMTVLFVPGADGVTITTHTEQEHAGALCRPVRQNMDKDDARHVTNFLELVQSKAEKMESAKPAVAPAVPSAPAPSAAPVVVVTQPAPAVVVPVAATQPIPSAQSSAPAATSTVDQDESLGELARKAREKKKPQQ